MTAPERPGPERRGPDYPPEWDQEPKDTWEDEEPDDDEEEQPQDAMSPAGLRVLTERCGTCIFRPGNPMRLTPGRVREMVDGSVAGGGYITCHDTLTYGANPDFGPAVCRGFYDAHGERSNLIRIMQRLGHVAEVPPPAKEDTRA